MSGSRCCKGNPQDPLPGEGLSGGREAGVAREMHGRAWCQSSSVSLGRNGKPRAELALQPSLLLSWQDPSSVAGAPAVSDIGPPHRARPTAARYVMLIAGTGPAASASLSPASPGHVPAPPFPRLPPLAPRPVLQQGSRPRARLQSYPSPRRHSPCAQPTVRGVGVPQHRSWATPGQLLVASLLASAAPCAPRPWGQQQPRNLMLHPSQHPLPRSTASSTRLRLPPGL